MTSEEFEKIYQIYFKDVYYYILSLSKDKYIAEDITSETFLKAIKAIDKFRGDAKLRIWLCQIAKNEYFSYLRKNKKLDNAKDLDDIIEKKGGNFFEKEIVLKEEFIEINNIINSSLKEPYEQVFRLRVDSGLSFKEIGNIFGKTDNWACVTFHRARKKILKELEDKS
ncbi:MAG: RNA polymerase sigma factor [Senegalia sp. (in: firmicutes)]|uniref:RNA polymerase sigma factor n=1 Tax=Senegalia sp. (in: firmicutes) TaxID=1924098 RepID=UPI003F99FB90